MRFLVLSLCLLAASPMALAKPLVLILESYHQGFAWDACYTRGIRAVLGDCCRIEKFEMDTKRLPETAYAAQADKAWQKIQTLRPDLVISGDDNALRLVGPKLANRNIPLVFLGINQDPKSYFNNTLPANVTGLLERPLMLRNISGIHQWLPQARRLLVLFDTETTSRIAAREVFRNQASLTLSGLRVDLKLVGQWQDWQRTVREAKQSGYDAIAVGLYQHVFDQQKNVDADTVLRWTSQNSTVPLFGFWDFAVGRDKTIGGLLLGGEAHGREAGEIAKAILNGQRPADIPPKVGTRGQLIFSRSQLARFGIRLPQAVAAMASYVD